MISNLTSRAHTHQIRSLVDLMVVGGNTVGIDRPILDARLANDRAPNILIYSSKFEFDSQIPLFKVPNREVTISNSLKLAFEKRFVMIEGGENFLKNLDSRVEWILIYRSNEFKMAENIKLNLKLNILHRTRLDDGELLWCKRVNSEQK